MKLTFGTLVVFVLQVSGGTIRDLLEGLRSVGDCRALRVLEEALRRCGAEEPPMANETTGELINRQDFYPQCDL